MADKVAKASKPQLRGMLQSQIKRNLGIAVVSCVIAAVAQKIFINDHRKNIYAEFYKTYDIEKDFNRIRNLGLFDSCAPDK